MPVGKTRNTIFMICLLLFVNLCVCGSMAFSGAGEKEIGPIPPPSVRSGSVGGPGIFGGGPSSGK